MSAPEVSPQDLVAALQRESERYLELVMRAVNKAPDGQWLSASEEQVRDLSAEFRRHVFEKAIQMRLDAAEAAFSPSTQPDDGQASGE